MKISDEITKIIREMKPASAPVKETSNLYTDLGFDSLTFVQLLIRIEETYSISIELMEMRMCLQIDKLIALVENKVKEAGHHSTSTNKSEKLGKNRYNRR